jgi:hypothetical protein
MLGQEALRIAASGANRSRESTGSNVAENKSFANADVFTFNVPR